MIFDIQKATITKRTVAFILDAILFAVLAVGFAWLIGLCCNYDSHLDANIDTQTAYTTYYKRTYGVDFSKNYDELGVAEQADWNAYADQFSNAVSGDVAVKISVDKLLSLHSKYLASHGVDLFVSDTEYNALSDDQKTAWKTAYEACSLEVKAEFGENALLMKPIIYLQGIEEEYSTNLTATEAEKANFTNKQNKAWKGAYEDCEKAFSNDLGYGDRTMQVFGFTLLMVSLGILLSMLILEFALPLIFKNGQTIGKKVFGIAVMHENGVRVNTITMFIRTFLGKYAVETMSPALLLLMIFTGNALIAVIVMAALVIFEIVLFVWKKETRPFIHDVFAKTVVVDLASQMIFNTEEEMQEFRRNTYAESSGDALEDKLYSTANPLASSFVEIKKTSDSSTSDKKE